MRDKFILLIVLIVMNAANAAAASQKISSSVINKLHQRSLILLAQYDLNPTNKGPIYKEPEVDFILPMNQSYVLDSIDSNRHNHSKLGFTLLQDACKEIGFDPALYIGKRIFRLNYLLDDSSQANNVITAHVLFSDTNTVGAHLLLFGSYPGIVALNDRSEFKPKHFVFPRFNSDLLDTVSIFGPWDKSEKGCDWINKVDYLSKEETAYFSNTFSNGKKVNADLHYWMQSPGDEYAAVIKFKTGERYSPHFIFRNDSALLNDYKGYYILDRKFIDFVTQIIKSRGISTCHGTQR